MNGFEMNWNTVKKKTIVDLMLESFLHLFIYQPIYSIEFKRKIVYHSLET